MTQANPQTPSETILRRGGTPEKTISDLGPLAHIETVQKREGKTFQQLQYSQQTNINFLTGGSSDVEDGLVMWPHVNVNTLIKQ